MLVRGNKLQYNGRGNSLRNQLGKTSTKPSREHCNYVGTFIRITLVHPESLQSRYPEDYTAKSRRCDLRRGRGGVMLRPDLQPEVVRQSLE